MLNNIAEGRRKKEEGRRKKEEGRSNIRAHICAIKNVLTVGAVAIPKKPITATQNLSFQISPWQ